MTGAGSGLGRAVAEAARAQGDRVVATARDTSVLADFDDALTLDVHNPRSVDAAVAETIHRHERIDVLVNNAGHGLVGAVEELSDDDLRTVLETNVFGVLRTTRAVLPHLRAARSGHIVQMSSVGGVVANPGHAAYATSKFALEGMSEALAAEVAPWGIRVTLVEPGPFRTQFAGRSMRYSTPLDVYADTPAGQLRQRFAEQDGRQPNDPAQAARHILSAVDDPAPPLRLPLGPEAADRIREKLLAQTAELDALNTRSPSIRDTRFSF
ncbi:SDR family NAD(P)-dependent oxidoreductase [Saccharomonospora piscinae]|uniref:SDR family NAD(P)-dependent oxidoreductase n=1 Tax=Saccharomonospora piscinae TaxID=687388 RepID=UPI001FC97126|nr:SDR family NAD(P)-dependent oxidoreductase [Saccharomonospora piscinae]